MDKKTTGRLEKITKTTLLKTSGAVLFAGGLALTYLAGDILYNSLTGNMPSDGKNVAAASLITGLPGLYSMNLGAYFLLPKKIRNNMDDVGLD